MSTRKLLPLYCPIISRVIGLRLGHLAKQRWWEFFEEEYFGREYSIAL